MDTDSDEFEVIDREEVEQAAVDLRQDWRRPSVFGGLLPWAHGTSKGLPANQRPSPPNSRQLLTTAPGAPPTPPAASAAPVVHHLTTAAAAAGVVSLPRPAPPRSDSSASLELFAASRPLTATPSAASIHAQPQLPLSRSTSVTSHLKRSGLPASRLPASSSTSSLCSGISVCSASSCEFCTPLPATDGEPLPPAHVISKAASRQVLGSSRASLSTLASSSGGLADLLLAEAEVSPAASERSLRISSRPGQAPLLPSMAAAAAQLDKCLTRSSSSMALAGMSNTGEGQSLAGVARSAAAAPAKVAAPLGDVGCLAAAVDVAEAAAPPAEELSREGASQEGVASLPATGLFEQQPALDVASAGMGASSATGHALQPAAATAQAAKGGSSRPPDASSMLQLQARPPVSSQQQQQAWSVPPLVAAPVPGPPAVRPAALLAAGPSAAPLPRTPVEAALAAAAAAGAAPLLSLSPSTAAGGLRSGGRQRRPTAHRAGRPTAAAPPAAAGEGPHYPHFSAFVNSGAAAAPPPPPSPSPASVGEAGLGPKQSGAYNSSSNSTLASPGYPPPWTGAATLGAVLALLWSTLERRLRASRPLLTLLAVAAMVLMLGAGALGGVRAAKHLGGSEAAELRLQQGGSTAGAARMLGQVGGGGGGGRDKGNSPAESWAPALPHQKLKEGRLVVLAPAAAGDLSPWGLEGQAPGGIWEDEQVLLGRQKGWVSVGVAPAGKTAAPAVKAA